MSQQMLAQLEELWSQVEAAGEEWDVYIESEEFDLNANMGLIILPDMRSNSASLVARVSATNLFVKALRARLCHLVKFGLNSLGGIPTDLATPSEELFLAHVPSSLLSTETASTFVHRTLSRLTAKLEYNEERIRAAEDAIDVRFEKIQANYDETHKTLTTMGDGLDDALKARQLVEMFADVVITQCGEEKTGDEDALLEDLGEVRVNIDWKIAVFERQMLKFKKNMVLIGVKMARQTLITEYMKGGLWDTD